MVALVQQSFIDCPLSFSDTVMEEFVISHVLNWDASIGNHFYRTLTGKPVFFCFASLFVQKCSPSVQSSPFDSLEGAKIFLFTFRRNRLYARPVLPSKRVMISEAPS